ncbi:TTL-domain-containing protein [Neocallimastix californiae]|uniref:TTL-domain-containing protein n=1 Tax=Neocallimastix californiae TaxID=1754190 RepID=A0A1Y1ZTF8_9FUNG|nr:TTL-domain-containing protein [Neocallimastix californiae]|eukprot:ORY13327.1 TTL-domain-containing protein [Neocallimastix californiae]
MLAYQVDRSINYSGCIGNKFKEFKKVKQQNLLMLSPSNYCKCHQRTVFFKYHDFTAKDNINENVNSISLNNKEYFVGGIQTFSSNKPYSKFSVSCLRDTLEYNNIIRLFNNTDSNLIWSNSSNKTIAAGLSKYQRFNHIVKHGQITLKDKLYNNFLRFQKKFPDDYTYMADTYTSERINQFKKKYRNYEISKDNLWLIKPKGAARGIGIHFLKNVDEINKTDIVTKYISNPLLLEKKKFDLRVYLLVTGHDPLKIYIYKESFARMSSDEYDLELEDLDNVFKHLTNVSVNKKKKTQNGSSFIWSLPKVKRYISEEYGVDFNEVWEKIEDIAIKAVITMNKLEIDTEKKMYSHLNSSNTFELYGVDILIDDNMKPWLLEINLSPGLSSKTGYQRSLKYKLMDDTFNIVGLVPYSHITGLAMEGECEYKDPVDEAVQQSVCEITRPTGGYKRIFPLKENIDYYKKFFEEVSPNNQALWDEIKKNENL